MVLSAMSFRKLWNSRTVSMYTCLALLAGLFMCGDVSAQVVGATLTGEVSDNTGAAVPGATVTVHNTATGLTRTVSANNSGFYTAPNLNPGNYEVRASAPGFSTLVQKNVVLTVGAEITFNPTLSVGGVQETVVVSAAPPSIETSSTAVGNTVDGTTVRELPLNGRDWTSLAALEPGVISVPNQATTGFSANKGNRGFGNQLTDGGHRPNENTYRVNGMVVNDYTNAAPGGGRHRREFGLNDAATAPFQIIGSDPNATLNTGVGAPNVNFNRQAIRNRYIQQDPKRAAVYN